jgi:hypothetical protein
MNMKYAINFLLLVLATFSLSACGGSPYYTSDPIEAWVVDAENGKPIEGAVVTANWQLEAFGFDTGGRKLHQLEVMETVTDSKGRFYFPGFTRLNPTLEELRDHDPQILIFKSGYEYSGASSNYPIAQPLPGPHQPSPGPHRHSRANGMTFKLKTADPDVKKYANNLRWLGSALRAMEYSGDLGRIPKMMDALNCEERRVENINPHALVYVPHLAGREVRCDK